MGRMRSVLERRRELFSDRAKQLTNLLRLTAVEEDYQSTGGQELDSKGHNQQNSKVTQTHRADIVPIGWVKMGNEIC
jgi:hypothetical protein